jgi:hypothetical protein
MFAVGKAKNGIGHFPLGSSSEVLIFQAIKPSKSGDDHKLQKMW